MHLNWELESPASNRPGKPTSSLPLSYCRMQSVQNAGLAAISQASGSLVDNNGYLILIVFYLVSIKEQPTSR